MTSTSTPECLRCKAKRESWVFLMRVARPFVICLGMMMVLNYQRPITLSGVVNFWFGMFTLTGGCILYALKDEQLEAWYKARQEKVWKR